MYLVKIKNGSTETTIHQTATSNLINGGTIKKEINKIEKFDFIIYPNNAGYNLINDLTTQVTVTNTKTSTLEFIGRVLKSVKTMDSDGLVYKSVTCENALGYLCDSIQYYTEHTSKTVTEYLTAVLNNHNLQVETYKKIYIGAVTLTDLINVTSTYKKTFEEIKDAALYYFDNTMFPQLHIESFKHGSVSNMKIMQQINRILNNSHPHVKIDVRKKTAEEVLNFYNDDK